MGICQHGICRCPGARSAPGHLQLPCWFTPADVKSTPPKIPSLSVSLVPFSLHKLCHNILYQYTFGFSPLSHFVILRHCPTLCFNCTHFVHQLGTISPFNHVPVPQPSLIHRANLNNDKTKHPWDNKGISYHLPRPSAPYIWPCKQHTESLLITLIISAMPL